MIQIFVILGYLYDANHILWLKERVKGGLEVFFTHYDSEVEYRVLLSGCGMNPSGKEVDQMETMMKELYESFRVKKESTGKIYPSWLDFQNNIVKEERSMDTLENVLYSFFFILKPYLNPPHQKKLDSENFDVFLVSNHFHIVRAKYLFTIFMMALKEGFKSILKQNLIFKEVEENWWKKIYEQYNLEKPKYRFIPDTPFYVSEDPLYQRRILNKQSMDPTNPTSTSYVPMLIISYSKHSYYISAQTNETPELYTRLNAELILQDQRRELIYVDTLKTIAFKKNNDRFFGFIVLSKEFQQNPDPEYQSQEIFYSALEFLDPDTQISKAKGLIGKLEKALETEKKSPKDDMFYQYLQILNAGFESAFAKPFKMSKV